MARSGVKSMFLCECGWHGDTADACAECGEPVCPVCGDSAPALFYEADEEPAIAAERALGEVRKMRRELESRDGLH